MKLKPGDKLGPYQIVSALGKGGMGEVWKARDPRLDRHVAIKVSAQQFTDRFEREARAIARLHHPNICTLFDVGPDYLVMEYIEGTPVKGPLPLGEVLEYAEQICDALDAAHSSGIVHRDLKPGNILLSKHGIKLLDFGLAQIEAGPGDPTITQLTQAGALMGTPAYMAPEQWEGKKADARSDIFAFGCVLHEMVTGKRATADRMAAIPRGPGPLPDVERIVSKCLEHDPDLRYQVASEIRTDLRRLQRDTEFAHVAANAKPLTKSTVKKVISAAAVVVPVLLAGYFYLPRVLHKAPKLTDKDTIVLADFANTTGDPVFDGTLRQGLAVQLEQSPFLNLLSDQRAQKVLGLMGQKADARLTPEIAKEICERTASAAVLEGSVVSLGSQFVLGLRAKNCRTGDVLDEEQVQAARKEDVLTALSQIASKFRTRVGEALATIKEHNIPLAEATTPSLEALKAYSEGLKVLSTSGDAASTPFFKHAADIDPQFAMAHARLGLGYGEVGESTLAAQSFGNARQLRARASDAEKFFIDAIYDLQVTGNLERAQRTCEEWARTYPREIDDHGFLAGMIYPVFGKYDQALEEAKKLVAQDPDFAIGYLQVAFNDTFLDHLDESDNALRQAAARKLEIPEFMIQRYDNAFLRGDRAGMEREVLLSRGKPELEDWLSSQEAFDLAYSGHLKQATENSRRSADLAARASRRERAALWLTGPALWAALFGNAVEARRNAKEARRLSSSRDIDYGAAFALALSGDSADVPEIVKDIETRYPEDTAVRSSYLPVIRALLLLKAEPTKAIEQLRDAAPYELGTPPSSAVGFYGNLYPVYVRGLAFLAAHQGAEAALEFRKILDHRNIVVSDPIGALAHLQLGRALVLTGDKVKARAAYQDFLTLWKDADPDIPIVMQAKTEYANL